MAISQHLKKCYKLIAQANDEETFSIILTNKCVDFEDNNEKMYYAELNI